MPNSAARNRMAGALQATIGWLRTGRARLDASPRKRLYVRGTLVLLAVWAVATLVMGWSVAASAEQAQGQARQLASTIQSTSPSALADPAMYLQMAAEAEETQRSLSGIGSRLGFLRPLEWVPVAGGRLREARNTAELGSHAALGVKALAELYADMLAGRISGEPMTEAVADEHRRQLREASHGLAEARSLAEEDLLLDDLEAEIVVIGVPLLHAAVALALESPSGTEALLDLLTQADSLTQIATDPWDMLMNAEALEAEAGMLAESAGGIASAASRVAGESAEAGAALLLLADAARATEALGRTGESLTGVLQAMDEGFLSSTFGVAASPLLDAASEDAGQAEAHTQAFRERLEELLTASGRDYASGGGVMQQIDGLTDDISRLSRMTQTMRSVLGYEGERTYLMIFQNQNEIRATGGFIGVTMEIHIENGMLLDVIYEESTSLDSPPLIDNPPSPEPLFWYLWMGRMLFRDANWNPHFPETAATLRDLYAEARGVTVDGVIAGTKLLAWELVDALGDVRVPHVDELLTRELTEQYTEGLLPYPCSDRHAAGRDQRCFDQDLAASMLERMREGVDTEQRERLLELVQRHLTMKNLLVYMDGETESTFLAEQRWDGGARIPAQDYLMVVDSSLPGHTAAVIHRTWDYRVVLRPGQTSRAELLLHYDNSSSAGGRPLCRQADHDAGGCYWNYVRVYLPTFARSVAIPPVALHEGTEKLIWGHSDVDSGEVSTHADGPFRGLTEVGAYLTVEPDSTLSFPINYDLAAGVVQPLSDNRYRYHLALAKQPGMNDDTVRLQVQLPDGANVNAASGARNDGNGLLSWEFNLTEDTEISVVFTMR